MGDRHRGAREARRRAIRRTVQRQHVRFYRTRAHLLPAADEAGPQPLRWYRERWVLTATAAAMTLLSAVAIPSWANALKQLPAAPEYTTLGVDLPESERSALEDLAGTAVEPVWERIEVQPGQTLSELFSAAGWDLADMRRVLDAAGDASVLKQLHPGDVLYWREHDDGSLAALRFEDAKAGMVTLSLAADGVERSVQAHDVERRVQVANGKIESSLFGSAQKAGLSEALVVQLADIFKYDIDFIKDIHRGDQFTVIYDSVYRNGSYVRAGDILAAEFRTGSERHTAYRYQDDNGKMAYYTEDGRPLRKSLLRTPVKFTRISSRFTGARKHPILGYTRAHKGVDYAAPSGTAIHAAGDGVIAFRGRERGYGNLVVVKHDGKYSTAYAHMSRFAAGQRVGSRVQQGQVIGYVGMTGLATGPHLHYEVRVNGQQVNPLTITMPKPGPLAPALLARFKQQTQPWLALIQRVDDSVRVAQADNQAPPRSNSAG